MPEDITDFRMPKINLFPFTVTKSEIIPTFFYHLMLTQISRTSITEKSREEIRTILALFNTDTIRYMLPSARHKFFNEEESASVPTPQSAA